MFSQETTTFKGHGEFVLANLDDIQIQIRQLPCGNTNISCIQAVCQSQ